MKKTFKKSMIFIAVLLLCSILFSLFYSVIEAKHDCEAHVCGICDELQTVENSLKEQAEEYVECEDKTCLACLQLQEQVAYFEKLSLVSHECKEGECFICYQIKSYEERAKQTLLLAFAVLFSVATAYGVCLIVNIHKEREIAQSLISMKVKLSI